MHRTSFRQNPLAAGVALALGVTATAPAAAQDEEVIEEIVTIGIRGSLMQSMDRKRNSKGVVDAITAEDIGKFPDTNLAESLQRITGVSIDRNNGEGSKITVRGMGPEFNLVTLNGRTMPNAGGRSFDFADIASEAVNAVEVYKTSKSSLPSGGIGATVNLITSKPLSVGFQSVISAKAVHETSASDGEGDDWTPEIAGIYSNTFADDTIGVLVSGSFQERDNREETANVDSWIPNRPMNDAATITDNNQRADGVTWYPQNAGYGWNDNSRKRTNAQLVLQYAPTDMITATLDYTYSKNEFEKDGNSFGVWFDAGGAMQSATINERGTFTEVTEAGGDYATTVVRDHTEKENTSLGLNLDWQVNDGLTLTFDVHDSESTNEGAGLGSLPGNTANLIIGNTFCNWCGEPTATLATKTARYDLGDLPIWDFTVENSGTGVPQDEIFTSDLGSLFGQAFNDDTKNEITQYQIGGEWINEDGGAIASIEFGYARTEQSFDSNGAYSGQLPAGFWLTSAQYWPDDGVFRRESLGGLLSEFSSGAYPIDYYYTADFDALVDGFETVGGNDPDLAGCCYWPAWGPDFQDPSGSRGYFWSGPQNSGDKIDEDIDSFYTQVNFEGDFNGMAMNAVLGIRYERTDVTSTGTESPPSAVVWIGGNEWQYEFDAGDVASSGGGSQKEWLPSLDVDMEIVEDLVARMSYGRSLARPPIGNMSSSRGFPGNPKLDTRDITVGNPDLLPYVSDNFDVSLEWYYGDGSYVSAGYFKKRVDNFLRGSRGEATVEGILDPYFGPRAEQARAELEAEGVVVTNTALFERINLNQGAALTDPIRAEAGDPLVVFETSSFENAQEANIHGWELAAQHMFGDTGWGVLANATFVSGDVEAKRDVVGEQFALEGLSDSANLSVFYENDFLSGRLAWNWRDEFLSSFDGASSPVFTEEYWQLDGNFTYNVNDNLAVFVEALNITEETQRTYVRYEDQFLRGNQYGARYNIGARYTFD